MRGKDHKTMKAVVIGWLSASILLISGCPVPCGWDAGPPSISFTSVPPFGSFANLRGRTSGVLPFTHRVVVYIRVGNTWWVKPTAASPLTVIEPGCNWETDITTGGLDHEAVEIRAFVVSEDYTAQVNALPPDDVVLASVTTTRKPGITLKDVAYIGSPAQLRGRVDDLNPAPYRVVAFIQVDGRWWVKPTTAQPLTPIADDRSWVVDISTANADAPSELRTTTNGFDGIRFSDSGDGVVSESTAHLALALRLAGQHAVADELLDSLRAMKENAPNTDGRGIVAAPATGDGVDSGLGARHFAVRILLRRLGRFLPQPRRVRLIPSPGRRMTSVKYLDGSWIWTPGTSRARCTPPSLRRIS